MSRYDCTQAMRRLETEVRNQKDIRETAMASEDTALVKQCNERIKVYNTKYSDVSNITGIPEEPRKISKPRIQKPDMNITSPALNSLKNSVHGGIINSGAISGAKNHYGEKDQEHAQQYYDLVHQ